MSRGLALYLMLGLPLAWTGIAGFQPVLAGMGLELEAFHFALPLACLASLPLWRWWWRSEHPEVDPALRRGGWWGLAGLMVVAAVVRLHGLDLYPASVDNDAALNARFAWGLHRTPWTPFTRELGVGVETGFFYGMGVTLRALGHTVFALRLPAVLATLLALPCLFLLVRELAGRYAGLMAVVVAAVSPWGMVMARSPKHSLLVCPVACLTLYGLVRGAREGRLRWYALAGVSLGAGMHTYQAYRPSVILFGAWIVADLLLRRRFGQEPPANWKRGYATAALAALPLLSIVIGFAVLHGGDYAQPMVQNTSIISRAPGAVVLGAWEVVSTALAELPSIGVGLGSGFSMLSIAGLPLLLTLRDPRSRALALLFVLIIIPPALARYHHTVPRRFVGLYPVIMGLPALVAWRFDAAIGELGAGWRRAFRAWLVAIAVVALGNSALILAKERPDWPRAEREVSLRALRIAVDEMGATGWVPAGFAPSVSENFSLGFFLLHERIQQLSCSVPRLPRTEERALILPGDTLLARPIWGALYGGERVSLRMPLRPFGEGPERVEAWLVPGRRPAPAALGERGLLCIPRDGRYRIAVPRGVVGVLELDGRPVLIADGAGASRVVPLACGIAQYRVRRAPESAPWSLSWTAPLLRGDARRAGVLPKAGAEGDGGRQFAFGTLLDGAFPGLDGWREFRPADVAPLGGRFDVLGTVEVQVDLSSAYQRYPYDLAVDPDGRLQVARLQRLDVLEGRDPASPAATPLPLRGPEGEPVFEEYAYEVMPAKAWSIASTPGGGWVVSKRLERYDVSRRYRRLARTRWVRVFQRDGRFRFALRPGSGEWIEPLDVAVARDGRIAVCDEARGEVWLFGADGKAIRHVTTGRPVSVAWLRGRLFVADARHLALIELDPRTGERLASRFVGRVEDDVRLAVARERGWLLFNDSSRVRLFDDRLRLLAIDGDPAAFDPYAGVNGGNVAVAWMEGRRELLVLDGHGDIHRHRLTELPAPALDRPSVEIPACGPSHWAGGNANRVGTTPFGPGILIDGGGRPSTATYRTAVAPGRYEVWLRYATGDARPLKVTVGEQSLAVAGAATGGYHARNLRWVSAGVVTLEAGASLSLVAEGLMPHVERILLVEESK